MKYKVRFSVQRITKLFADGKCVAEIARAIGYPPNTGQNRVTNALVKAGVYKVSKRRKSTKK